MNRNWGPIRDLEVILQLPNNRAVLATYQLSTEMSSPSYVVTGLSVNGFYQQTTPFINGKDLHLDLHGAMATHYKKGVHYFNMLYRSTTTFSFSNCQHDYRDNKSLRAMMLPPSCRVTAINPRTTLSLLKTNKWLDTDLKYSLPLSRLCYFIII